MKDIDYKFWAGPGGRVIAGRLKRYKRTVFVMSGFLFLEAVAIAVLVMAYFKLLKSII